jgi:hypothetical protein
VMEETRDMPAKITPKKRGHKKPSDIIAFYCLEELETRS